MKHHIKIGERWNVMPLLLELSRQPHLWDRNKARMFEGSPHRETHDIWVRYKDETENKATGDYGNFTQPHDDVWYPSFYELPSARRLIFDLMARVEGERLGGVLIYSIPPHKRIYPHVDTGWYVENFEKFNICLQSNPDAKFLYEDDGPMIAAAGDVHRFRNDILHWVVNDGEDDHIMLAIGIQTTNYKTRVKDAPTP